MRLRTPAGYTVIATAIAWVVWAITVTRTIPADLGVVGWCLFYGITFLAASGTATVVGLLARRHHPDRARAHRITIRQGVLTGLAVTAALGLQSLRLFSWVNMLFLIATLTLLEFFWISMQRQTNDSGIIGSTDDS